MINKCDICGKPGSYPNFLISHGRGVHVGCMADAFNGMAEALATLFNMHQEQVFICGQDDQAATASALSDAAQALKKAGRL